MQFSSFPLPAPLKYRVFTLDFIGPVYKICIRIIKHSKTSNTLNFFTQPMPAIQHSANIATELMPSI